MPRGTSKATTQSRRVASPGQSLTSKQILQKVFAFVEKSLDQAVRYRQAHEPGDLAPHELPRFYHAIGHMITILENSEIKYLTDHDAVATLVAMSADSTVH